METFRLLPDGDVGPSADNVFERILWGGPICSCACCSSCFRFFFFSSFALSESCLLSLFLRLNPLVELLLPLIFLSLLLTFETAVVDSNGMGMIVIEDDKPVDAVDSGIISMPGLLSKLILFRTELAVVPCFPTSIVVMLTDSFPSSGLDVTGWLRFLIGLCSDSVHSTVSELRGRLESEFELNSLIFPIKLFLKPSSTLLNVTGDVDAICFPVADATANDDNDDDDDDEDGDDDRLCAVIVRFPPKELLESPLSKIVDSIQSSSSTLCFSLLRVVSTLLLFGLFRKSSPARRFMAGSCGSNLIFLASPNS